MKGNGLPVGTACQYCFRAYCTTRANPDCLKFFRQRIISASQATSFEVETLDKEGGIPMTSSKDNDSVVAQPQKESKKKNYKQDVCNYCKGKPGCCPCCSG